VAADRPRSPLGDEDSAIRANKEVIALDPDFPLGHLFLGLTYGDGLRRYDLAIPEFQKAVELSGRGSYTVCTLGAAYARSGKRDEAIRLLKELEEKYAKREANGTDIAIIRAALGDDDRAIDWLEKDFDAGNTVFLAYVTNLTSLHERLRSLKLLLGGSQGLPHHVYFLPQDPRVCHLLTHHNKQDNEAQRQDPECYSDTLCHDTSPHFASPRRS
jgi:tetratricopeptide (TPR) repeat protein